MCVISGEYNLEVLRRVTSFPVDGAKFVQSFKDGYWDGRKHLFDKRLKAFPAGLLDSVQIALKLADPTLEISTVWCGEPIPGPQGTDFQLEGLDFGTGIYDYQLEAAKRMILRRRGVLKLATNAGKTAIAIAVTKFLGLPTLFLVEGKELIYQTQKAYAKYLGVPEDEIGIIGDSLCQVRPITIASPASFLNRVDDGSVHREWKLLFMDECHGAGADTYYAAASVVKAPYRFGLSGTPLYRTDGANLKLIAQTGEIIYEVRNKLLIDRGISVPTSVKMIPITEPKLPKKTKYAQVEVLGVRENEQLNSAVVDNAMEQASNGYQVLIMVDKISHGKLLIEKLIQKNSKATFITGKESGDTRQKVLEDFKKGKIRILIATSILDQGVDLPNIDVLILAGGGKSKIQLLQRIGRGLRSGKDKTGLLVIDFANFTHKYLTKHSMDRLQTYHDEDCFVISKK